jgi:glycyl-tRNA synthetase
VVDKRGNLMPVFIAVRNGDAEHLDTVIGGNEHVIRARFADARFFYNEDIKKSLADHLPGLKLLAFHEQLGSYYDKVTRLEGITARLGSLLGLGDDELDTAIRAARLCKADLTTSLVVEMTSLQGVMGGIYAQHSGEPEGVARAIAEHYKPRYAGDALPETPPGVAVALADRLDSLVGLLGVGLAPTGSADPYGLRRAALGVVQILLGHHLDLDLGAIVEWIAQAQPVKAETDVRAAVLDFVAGRLYGVLREDQRHDVVEAALGAQGHNPYRAAVHAEQLARWVARADWQQILDAFARCVRITRGQEKQFKLKPDAFSEVVEKELFVGYGQMSEAIGTDADVDTFLTAFDPLVAAISAFFAPAEEGGVLVMDEKRAVRENRLALLQHIVALAEGVADFSRLEGF